MVATGLGKNMSGEAKQQVASVVTNGPNSAYADGSCYGFAANSQPHLRQCEEQLAGVMRLNDVSCGQDFSNVGSIPYYSHVILVTNKYCITWLKL